MMGLTDTTPAKAKAAKPRTPQATKSKSAPKRSNPAGRPTPAELERRKELAIKVATELFVANGYAATTLVDIAKGAGVATRTIYQHFGDKEAMFREVIFARDNETALRPPVVGEGETLFMALSRLADYADAITFGDRSIGLMRLMIAESNRFPDFMRSVVNSIYHRFHQNMSKMFISLSAAGMIPPDDHRRSAELFADVILGASPIMTYTSWATSPPEPNDRNERIAFFILGRFGAKIAETAETRKVEFTRQD